MCVCARPAASEVQWGTLSALVLSIESYELRALCKERASTSHALYSVANAGKNICAGSANCKFGSFGISERSPY